MSRLQDYFFPGPEPAEASPGLMRMSGRRKKMKRIALALMMLPGAPELVTAQWSNSCAYGAPGPDGFHGFAGGNIMWVITVAILGVLIFCGTRFLDNDRSDGNAPMKILKERYARGDITREKYYSMKKDLA